MKRTLLALILIASLGLAAAQTLVFANSGQPSTLDSVDSQDGESLVVSNQITETLIFYGEGSAEVVPRLATSWSPNVDGSVWTFELRQGVSFHDGTPFNAEAVKFNLDRWNIPDHPYAFRDQGKTYVPWGWFFGGPVGEGNLLEEVVVIDEYTVELRLTQPAPALPAFISAVYYQIDSPAAVMAAGADYGTPGVGSVGTGPFKFVEWLEGQQVTLEANEDYWGGAPEVERLVFRAITEQAARLAELRAGTVDIAISLAVDDLETIQNDPNLVAVIPETELNVGYLALHQANPPLDNLLVRRAIAHAIDREAIVEAFFAGTGQVAADHMPPSFFGHGTPWPYEYDPERARELLTEAGYPDGFASELWYMPVSRPYFPNAQPVAEAMASYLADVGIMVDILSEDWTTYLSDYNTGKFPMYMLGWNGDYPDPDNFLTNFFGASAVDDLGWDRPEVVAALNMARQIADQEERARLYAFVIDSNAAQAASIPMAHNATLNATRANIEGWVMSPLGYSSTALHKVIKR